MYFIPYDCCERINGNIINDYILLYNLFIITKHNNFIPKS